MLRQPDAEAHVHYRWGNYPHMNAVGQAMSTNCCETSDSEELMACKERFTQTDVQRPTEPALVANSLRSVGSTLYRAHIASADALSSVLRSAQSGDKQPVHNTPAGSTNYLVRINTESVLRFAPLKNALTVFANLAHVLQLSQRISPSNYRMLRRYLLRCTPFRGTKSSGENVPRTIVHSQRADLPLAENSSHERGLRFRIN